MHAPTGLPTLVCLALLLLSIHGAPAGRAGDPVEQPWERTTRLPSNGGAYLVALAAQPDPIPENELFGLTVWVLDPARPERPLADVALEVDAAMPEHGHGMNREPVVARRDDGGFDVRGMMLHMGGTWELYLDVTRGPLTERTQLTVKLQ